MGITCNQSDLMLNGRKPYLWILHIVSKSTFGIKKCFCRYCKVYHTNCRSFWTNMGIAHDVFIVYPRMWVFCFKNGFIWCNTYTQGHENCLVIINKPDPKMQYPHHPWIAMFKMCHTLLCRYLEISLSIIHTTHNI